MDLINVRAFTRTVETGGLSRAALSLGLSKSTVSRRIAVLEQAVGERLLERSSRCHRVTEAGRVFYEHGRRMLAEWEAAQSSLHGSGEPRGVLRLSAPLILGKSALPQVLADFMATHRGVRLHSDFTNRRVNLIEEGFDIALRGGALPDSSLVSRRLTTTCDRLYASAACLARGRPIDSVDDLRGMTVLDWAPLDAQPLWQLQAGEARATIPVEPWIVTCDSDVMCRAAAAGHGIAKLPEFVGRAGGGRAVATGAAGLVEPTDRAAPGLPIAQEHEPGAARAGRCAGGRARSALRDRPTAAAQHDAGPLFERRP